MKNWWIMRCVKFSLLAIAGGMLMAYITMLLWNNLLPGIAGLPLITFWQSVGILILTRLLFGMGRGKSCCGGGVSWKGGWRERLQEKMNRMSPEEREKFKSKFSACCGPRWNEPTE